MNFFKSQYEIIKQNDPALHTLWEVLLYPSFRAQIYYKLAHYLYKKKYYFFSKMD